MRKGLVGVALLFGASVLTGWGEGAKEETLARWHFVGTRQIAGTKDLQRLNEILALKESQELRKVAVAGFASRVASHFTHGTDTNANNQVAALIKPLLPDLIESESRFELLARGAQDADWSLAVKLPPERLAEWNSNLTALAGAARMRVEKNEKGDAWRAQRESYHFTVSPAKEWLVLEGGFGTTPSKKAKTPKSGGKEILSAELNCPAIAKIWDAQRFEHAPKLSLTVAPRKGSLRSEMSIDYPQSLNITPERWNVPIDLIKDPLVGFTAIQGIAGRLGQNPTFNALGAQKTPNQLFLWSQGTMAFTVFAAADVGNPGTVISNVVTRVLPSLKGDPGGKITVLTNRPAIIWRGLPVVVPFVEAANAGQSPYLLGGLFPVSTEEAKSAPPELFEQLNKKNLVYYDWEITQERLKQWRPIWQFAQILQGKIFPASASDQWIEAITPKLENTVTEVTLQSANRLKLVRQSQSGFTALELVLLAHVLDPNDVVERSMRPPGQPAPRRNAVPQKIAPTKRR